jgi:hypothetical protein
MRWALQVMENDFIRIYDVATTHLAALQSLNTSRPQIY